MPGQPLAIPFPGLTGLHGLKETMEAAVRKIIESTLVSADGIVGNPLRWPMEYREEAAEFPPGD